MSCLRTRRVPRKIQQGRFVLQRKAFEFTILAQAFYILVSQFLNTWQPGLANPRDFELHEKI